MFENIRGAKPRFISAERTAQESVQELREEILAKQARGEKLADFEKKFLEETEA